MESLPYVHPALVVNESSTKGRLVNTTLPVKCGDIVLLDAPNALVPAMLADEPPYLMCSRHECYRRISFDKQEARSQQLRCSLRCQAEVVWCSPECQSLDAPRHDLECLWLKKTSRQICDAYGDGEFVLMWLIVRILIVRHLFGEEPQRTETGHGTDHQPIDNSLLKPPANHQLSRSSSEDSHFQRRRWEAVWNLEGDPAFFSPDKVQHWRTMTENFICNGILPLKYPLGDIIKLICKVETNSFGLYPGVTGQFPVVPNSTRGDYYGGGIYPTAAMFNHSCCPNITHQVDDFGRRIFKAGRTIEVGEELCISYFDLAEFPVYGARREAIMKSWSFACDCRRCDDDLQVPDHLQMMALDF